MIGGLPRCLALLRSRPIAEAHSQLLHALNAANTRREIGAEETAVGGLVCEPARSTTILLRAKRGSEQYQSTTSSMAWR